jgi:hypothetical protein
VSCVISYRGKTASTPLPSRNLWPPRIGLGAANRRTSIGARSGLYSGFLAFYCQQILYAVLTYVLNDSRIKLFSDENVTFCVGN